MNRLLNRANSRISLGSAAALLAGAALIGTLLGILRTRLVYANFPQLGPESTDAFFAAFKIPDLVYFTVAAGALGVAFMPILSEHTQRGDKRGTWLLTSSLLNLIGIVMGALAIILILFASPLMHLVAPKLTPEQFHNGIIIMRLVALNPLLFAISAILSTMQQVYGRFFFYALAPLLYNISIIAGLFIFKDSFGLVALGLGAFVGGIVQLLVVCLGMFGLKPSWRPKILWRSKDFRSILAQLPARSIDQGIDQINSIAETRFASRLGQTYISSYEGALTLHNAPTQLIGTAISTAAFPHFTERLAQGRPDLFRKEFLQVLRAMIWIAIPVVVICYFTRGYLARLIYADKAPTIALLFGYLSFAIFFRTIYSIISRYFYAQKDTRTPLYVSLFIILLNIYLAATLSRASNYGVAGLAMAQSIASSSEVIILMTIMLVRDPKLLNMRFWGGVGRIISVTGFTAMIAMIMVSFFPLQVEDRGLTLIAKLTMIGLPAIGVHMLISWILGLEEIKPILSRIKQLIFRPVKIQ